MEISNKNISYFLIFYFSMLHFLTINYQLLTFTLQLSKKRTTIEGQRKKITDFIGKNKRCTFHHERYTFSLLFYI